MGIDPSRNDPRTSFAVHALLFCYWEDQGIIAAAYEDLLVAQKTVSQVNAWWDRIVCVIRFFLCPELSFLSLRRIYMYAL